MSIRYILCEDKKEWENYLDLFPEANFLQSWNWGDFQEKMGKNVVRLVFFMDNSVVSMTQMILENARRGKYFAIAGGPLVDWENEERVVGLFKLIREVAVAHDVVWVRFRPQYNMDDAVKNILSIVNSVQSPMHLTADLTLVLDLSFSEEELLRQMRKTTRQSIKKAQTKGIVVRQESSEDALLKFYKEQVVLAERHHFVPFSHAFLLEQFKAFSKDGQALLLNAYLEDTLLASAFVIFYRNEAVYHYGVSTAENASLPGSYACQWAAILEAKKRGIKTYNFWGVAPDESARTHRFAGVTLFKKGFGGSLIQYVPAQDIIIRPLFYYPLYIFEQLRKKIRRL